MTANAKAGLLLCGITIVLLTAAVGKTEGWEALVGNDVRAMPTAQAGDATRPSRAVSALTGAHPYRGGN